MHPTVGPPTPVVVVTDIGLELDGDGEIGKGVVVVFHPVAGYTTPAINPPLFGLEPDSFVQVFEGGGETHHIDDGVDGSHLVEVDLVRIDAVDTAFRNCQGFEYLLNRDVDAAIEAFGKAFEIWPDYHNVQEIVKTLEQARERLRSRDDRSWNKLYRMILTQYSWGLPNDLRLQFREKTKAAY